MAAARAVARQLGNPNHNAELLRQRQIQAQANFGGQNLAANGHAGAYGSPAPAAAYGSPVSGLGSTHGSIGAASPFGINLGQGPPPTPSTGLSAGAISNGGQVVSHPFGALGVPGSDSASSYRGSNFQNVIAPMSNFNGPSVGPTAGNLNAQLAAAAQTPSAAQVATQRRGR